MEDMIFKHYFIHDNKKYDIYIFLNNMVKYVERIDIMLMIGDGNDNAKLYPSFIYYDKCGKYYLLITKFLSNEFLCLDLENNLEVVKERNENGGLNMVIMRDNGIEEVTKCINVMRYNINLRENISKMLLLIMCSRNKISDGLWRIISNYLN